MAKKKDGDYDGWILRLIDKIEDLDYAYNVESWLKFAGDKIESYHGKKPSKAQNDVLLEKRDSVFMLPLETGISIKQYEKLSGTIKTRYRDLDGRWGHKGAFISREKANAQVMADLATKGRHRPSW